MVSECPPACLPAFWALRLGSALHLLPCCRAAALLRGWASAAAALLRWVVAVRSEAKQSVCWHLLLGQGLVRCGRMVRSGRAGTLLTELALATLHHHPLPTLTPAPPFPQSTAPDPPLPSPPLPSLRP